MLRFEALLLATLFATTCWPVHGAAQQASVLGYHGHSDRSGNFVVPGLTWEKARSLHSDRGFHAAVFRACLRPAALLACARLELRHAAGRDRTKRGARARCRHRQGTLAARRPPARCAV